MATVTSLFLAKQFANLIMLFKSMSGSFLANLYESTESYCCHFEVLFSLKDKSKKKVLSAAILLGSIRVKLH